MILSYIQLLPESRNYIRHTIKSFIIIHIFVLEEFIDKITERSISYLNRARHSLVRKLQFTSNKRKAINDK